MTDRPLSPPRDPQKDRQFDNGLDASLLTEVEHLQLTARLLVQGALAGMHRSSRRGTSIEFSEHKLYTPGDDIRHIDWRAYAKTDRYHIKQFEDETNLRVEVLLDHSGSMGFSASSRPSKLEYARSLASALCYLALRQGDSSGLLIFANVVTQEVGASASSGHLYEILKHMTAVRADGETGIAQAIDHVARTRRQRSVVIVLTDLFDPNPDLRSAFRRLAARNHDISVSTKDWARPSGHGATAAPIILGYPIGRRISEFLHLRCNL